jgi:hypothetical protein
MASLVASLPADLAVSIRAKKLRCIPALWAKSAWFSPNAFRLVMMFWAKADLLTFFTTYSLPADLCAYSPQID